ncbi:hypothetical protein [Streptomyces antibioticus]|uniref:hypothetical protein n=1 Tax=Streptomyces antibioticus TaxID=1890 RepID=UPI003686B8F9
MPQRVRVPLRVIVGSYSDCVLPVYVKVAALMRRETGCEAGVAYLAGLLGVGRSTIERAFTEMMRPDPVDDVVELISDRRTWEVSGTGRTAARWIRKVSRSEHGAWVPTRAAEALNSRELRCYAAISYATAVGQEITLAELARVLRNRSGKKAGQALNVRSVRRILRNLEDLGWIGVERRAGFRGRHHYTVYDEPVQAALTADTEEGSAGDLGEGSLAYKEHHQTDSPEEPPAGGSIRRRRTSGSSAGEDLVPLPPQKRRPYGGPRLTFAPRMWAVLRKVIEPVAPLLPSLTPWETDALWREIARQLDEGQEPERLRARLEYRFASTRTIQTPARWLLGPALKRNGCGLTACESGRIWHTGVRCDVCAELRAAGDLRPPAWHPSARRPEPPGHRSRWHECDACRAPSRTPLPDGVCRACRPPEPLTLLRRWQS